MSNTVQHTWREKPLLFGRNKSLMGIITEPTKVAGPPIIILSAGILHRIGPSRSFVTIARRLATAGYPVLRFDLSGIGDSQRSGESSLRESVLADISDAVDLMMKIGVTDSGNHKINLIGFCSGADNGFYYAADDDRIGGLVMLDPTIHRTDGYRRRERLRRLKSARSWWNIISGRSLYLRIKERVRDPVLAKAPDHYGLLVAGRTDADKRAERLKNRNVPVAFVMTHGAVNYCNDPKQIHEALPNGVSPALTSVYWRMDFDHVLSTRVQIDSFVDMVKEWIQSASATES